MSFKDDIINDLDSVFFNTDEFAEQVTYTDHQGLQSNITAIVDREGNMDPEDRGFSGEIEARATIWVKVSDIPDPRFQDTVIITSPAGEEETWEVRDVRDGDVGVWELGLRRDLRVTY